MREMNKISGGETNGSYWFRLINRRYQPTEIMTLNPNVGQVIGSFPDTGIRDKRLKSLKVRV